MAEERQDRGSDKLVYFLIGAGIGAVTALLFAPKAGSELRADLADAARRSADSARDLGRQVGERATDYYHAGVDAASDLTQRGREAVSNITDRSREAVNRQKAQVSAAIEAGKQGYREAKLQDQAAKSGAAFEES
jgi:gas vesicle protein